MGWLDPAPILEALVRAKLADTIREFSGIVVGCAVIAASSKIAPWQEYFI